eukprot:TRINITY_DN18319_c0_g1_i1.p1 TRINITY_DN18319_c0_g1~~TRINITY_DN18319_c0_g1_i1.p1  ORF type:complete len:100 (-),score=6.79 TRINITY_DN18319_c0_g1_i1:300-599(-)
MGELDIAPKQKKPDLLCSVAVNDKEIEQIALQSEDVDITEFVQTLSNKYFLSPQKSAKVQSKLSRYYTTRQNQLKYNELDSRYRAKATEHTKTVRRLEY